MEPRLTLSLCSPAHSQQSWQDDDSPCPDFFGFADELKSLEATYRATTGATRCRKLCRLAWYLRQRDSRRAAALAGEARALLDAAPDMPGHAQLAGRLLLVEAENRYLFGDLRGARDQSAAARALLEDAGDLIGAGDAQLCDYHLAVDRGDEEQTLAHAAAAIRLYERAGHKARWLLARARLAQRNIVMAPRDAKLLRELRREAAGVDEPGLAASLHFIEAWHQSSGLADHKAAARTWREAFEEALEAGADRQALTACINLGVAYNNLYDNASSLEWFEKVVAMARERAWPVPLGNALGQTAAVLREVGNPAAAQELLREALEVLSPFHESRHYAHILRYYGEVKLETKHHEEALQCLEDARALATRLKSPDLVASALNGKARALSALDRADDAQRTALEALEKASTATHKFTALRTLASVSRKHGFATPAHTSHPSAPIHYLEEALRTSSAVADHHPPADLYSELSADHEAAGDLVKALAHQRAACAALEAERTVRAKNLATAMQVRYETERAHAEAEHHRLLAESEARRSEALQNSLATLEHLASIGQEITVNLDAEAVFATLHRHVGSLLHAPFVAIFVLEGPKLVLRYGMELGSPLPMREIPVDDADSCAARCLREQRTVGVDWSPDDAPPPSQIPGTQRVASALFAPLSVQDKALGVLSIQSEREQAYGDREHRILHTLAAYAAVALANVDGARQLADAQAELEREKMRSLLVHAGKLATIGRLASGMIHELSHPVGALGLQVEALEAMLQRDPSRTDELVPDILHELARLRTLIERLRNMARSDPPRIEPVLLHDVLKDAYRMFGPRLVAEQVHYEQRVPRLNVQADRDLLALAITNIVSNAIDAMKHSPRRAVQVEGWEEAGEAVLVIRDSGTGLHESVLQNLFKPFFTTKPAGAGLGLGLTLSAEYLAAMQARIEARNPADGGAEFRVTLAAC